MRAAAAATGAAPVQLERGPQFPGVAEAKSGMLRQIEQAEGLIVQAQPQARLQATQAALGDLRQKYSKTFAESETTEKTNKI